MTKKIFITIDIDWAPDYMISFVSDLLIRNNLKATWFITHASPVIDELSRYPELFELGIHPNFMPNSTHGNSIAEVIDCCNKLVPAAHSVRTHGYFQSWNILEQLVKNSSVALDCSVYSPRVTTVEPITYYYSGNRKILRVPTIWEDHLEILRPDAEWNFLNIENIIGPSILNFHPVHLFCNTVNIKTYTDNKLNLYDAKYITDHVAKAQRELSFGPLFAMNKLISKRNSGISFGNLKHITI